MTIKNPWRGLASYEEPKGTSDDYLFCGRDEETLDVVRLIDNNLFITLYGSSGIGKTSLLKAGVIPILKRKDYYPLYVRLSQEPKELSYAEAIVKKLQSSGLKEERSIALEHPEGNDRLYLWNYFATTRFRNAEGREVYPVIILDQFEEVFRDADKRKAELLLQQIYLLLNDELEMPNWEGYSADTNYRFVASIREDFLFVLEDSIDEFSLDLYKNNRYRLRPMKLEKAKEVVLIPGKDCIEESQKEKVAERVIELSKKQNSNEIDTLLLSLVCYGTYNKVASDMFATGQEVSIFEEELWIWGNNPMERYYQKAIKGLTANQIRYIQQHLIREDGSRRRMDAEEVKAALGEATYRQLTQGANRLLSIGDKGQVELLHDQLGLAVYEERKAFEERERKKKLRKRTTFIGIIVFAIVGVFLFQNHQLKQQQWKMLENQARFIAEKANSFINEGDSYLAQRILLEVLPDQEKRPQRPITMEVEAALRKAIYQNTFLLRGHKSNVNTAVFSPDGKRIVTASDDKTIRIWDAETGIELMKLEGHTSEVNSASFSPDGKRIISSSWDKTIRIWDADSGDPLNVLKNIGIMKSAIFSPDGKCIASFCDSTIQIWNSESGEQLHVLEGHTEQISSIAFSPDSKRIVSASFDCTARIWDAETGLEIIKWEGQSVVLSAAFSSNGRQIVAACLDCIILDANTGEEIQKIKTSSLCYSASFSPDDQFVVYTTRKEIALFEIKTEHEEYLYNSGDYAKSAGYSRYVSFSPDGKRIASLYDKNAIILNIYSKQKRTMVEKQNVCDIVFSPDNRRMVSTNLSGIVIWDVESCKKIKEFDGYNDLYKSAGFSADGKRIFLISTDDTIRICDAETGKIFRKIFSENCHLYGSKANAFSPDGKRIISATQYFSEIDFNFLYEIRIWNVESGEQLNVLNGGPNAHWFRFVAFSPDGKRIASASDTTVQIWNVDSGKQLHLLKGHTDDVYYVAFSPDGKRIVSTCSYSDKDFSIRIWDTESGDSLHVLKGHTEYIRSIAFSPDSKRIVSASGDNLIIIWNALTGEEIRRITCSSWVSSATFSLNGKYVISNSGDIQIWDAETGTEILNLGFYRNSTFSPNGRFIATYKDKDKYIQIWDFPPLQELINQTRERFKDRPLTPEERRMYYLE